MVETIDKISYPLTLGIAIIITFVIFAFFKKLRVINRRFEKGMAIYIVIHQIATVFVFYLMFGKGPGMMQTDLSPFVFILSMFPLFTGRVNWLRKALMPYLLVSGMVTMATSKPGFSYSFNQDWKYLPMFIESIFTYVKHTMILIIGIYFLFTNERYTKWEWGFGLFIPVTLISWIMVGSGIFYWVTDNPRYGRVSTGLLLPSQIPWGGYEMLMHRGTGEAQFIYEGRYNQIIHDHDWQDLFVKIGNKYYAKHLITKALWGETFYSGDAAYTLVTKASRELDLKNYEVVSILYPTATGAGFLLMILSQLGKHKIKH